MGELSSSYQLTRFFLNSLLQVFYTNNGAREAFVELCASEYVQKVTFDSYLYKKVQGNNPFEDIKLLVGREEKIVVKVLLSGNMRHVVMLLYLYLSLMRRYDAACISCATLDAEHAHRRYIRHTLVYSWKRQDHSSAGTP